jgi:hypothetical protein
VDEAEESYLRGCWERNVCPYCGRRFSATERVGGSSKKGGFCSLKCFGDYYVLDLAERHKRRVEHGGANGAQ